jgi:hypothetical protein
LGEPHTWDWTSMDRILFAVFNHENQNQGVSPRIGGQMRHTPKSEPRSRLPETTRAYARGKFAESGELDAMTRRRTEYSRELLRAAA